MTNAATTVKDTFTKSFSNMQIKAVEGSARKFTGIASTATPDLVNDVMVPEGAKYKLPMPFLFHHDREEPIGLVTAATIKPDSIEIEFEFPDVVEPGELQDRVNEALQSIKYKLITGLSIGFKVDWAFAEMLPTGGIKYNQWYWFETSLVTIACNTEAEITSAKAFKDYKAALGKGSENAVPSGVTDTQSKHTTVQLMPKGGILL